MEATEAREREASGREKNSFLWVVYHFLLFRFMWHILEYVRVVWKRRSFRFERKRERKRRPFVIVFERRLLGILEGRFEEKGDG